MRVAGAAVAALVLAMLSTPAAWQDTPVDIRVDTRVAVGPFKPVWAWFGNDEPNYAYMSDGQKLLGELAAATLPRQGVSLLRLVW